MVVSKTKKTLNSFTSNISKFLQKNKKATVITSVVILSIIFIILMVYFFVIKDDDLTTTTTIGGDNSTSDDDLTTTTTEGDSSTDDDLTTTTTNVGDDGIIVDKSFDDKLNKFEVNLKGEDPYKVKATLVLEYNPYGHKGNDINYSTFKNDLKFGQFYENSLLTLIGNDNLDYKIAFNNILPFFKIYKNNSTNSAPRFENNPHCINYLNQKLGIFNTEEYYSKAKGNNNVFLLVNLEIERSKFSGEQRFIKIGIKANKNNLPLSDTRWSTICDFTRVLTIAKPKDSLTQLNLNKLVFNLTNYEQQYNFMNLKRIIVSKQ
jgi:hypothetical protein